MPNYPILTLTLSFQDQIFCHWRLTLRLFSKAIFKPILKPSKIGKSFNIERYKKPRCHTLLSGLGSERCWWRKSWRRWSSAASWAAGCWGAHWGQGPGLSIWWGPPSRWNRRRRCWSRSPPPHSSRGQAIDTCSGKILLSKNTTKCFLVNHQQDFNTLGLKNRSDHVFGNGRSLENNGNWTRTDKHKYF